MPAVCTGSGEHDPYHLRELPRWRGVAGLLLSAIGAREGEALGALGSAPSSRRLQEAQNELQQLERDDGAVEEILQAGAAGLRRPLKKSRGRREGVLRDPRAERVGARVEAGC